MKSTSTSPYVTLTSTNMTSNLTEEERWQYLRHLDNEKWPYIYPVIIYLLILMVLGILGNSLVFVVYLKKFKPGTTRIFIMTLAVFDLLTCSLSIPGVIVELRYHYTFVFPGLCKLFRASRMYFVLVSLFTLIIVAVDRYRKVCRPLKRQYTIRSAWLSIFASNGGAMLLTILGAVVGGNRTVPTDREDVFGSNCSYDDKFIGKAITKVYSVVLFLVFIVCVTLLVVLYVLIGRQVWKHRRFSYRPKKNENSSSESRNQTSSTDVVSAKTSPSIKYILSKTSNDKETGKPTESTSPSLGSEDMVSIETKPQQTVGVLAKPKPTAKEAHKAVEKSNNAGRNSAASRTTFTLFVITVVFILSFLPFLILVALWGSNWMYVNSLHGYVFTVYKIFFHSYHVNNVVNCYVYGFCNPRFRIECKQLLLFWKSKK